MFIWPVGFFSELPIYILTPFFIELLVFLILIHKSTLYVLDIIFSIFCKYFLPDCVWPYKSIISFRVFSPLKVFHFLL